MNFQIIKKVKKITASMWLFFLDLVFPIECLGCGRDGLWLCGGCFKKIKFKPRQYCLHCKKENDFGQFCPSCGVNYDLDGVWIAALYDELLISRAIKDLKYHFITALADDLSRLIILFVDKMIEPSRDLKLNSPAAILNFNDNLVVPVTLAKKRLRWRGFNQAELLARKVAGKYNLELDSGNLIRVKHKKPQAKLAEVARLKNIKDCFEWRGGDLKKKNIILIDDVVTTGATLNECAKVLKAAGAGQVFGLVVAKG